MNPIDREKIDASCEKLAREVDMFELWPQLLANQIFNPDDINIPQWINSLDCYETKIDIISTIKTRGPYAFKNFLLSLRQCGYDRMADNLNDSKVNLNYLEKEIIYQLDEIQLENNSERKKEEKNDNEDEDEESEEEDYYNDINPLKISIRKSTFYRDLPVKNKYDIDRYIMRSKPRGQVLIVCIIEYTVMSVRTSAKEDLNNLKELFEKMGFEVTVAPTKLNGSEILETVQKFADQKKFRTVDSCFVIFSCHGFQAGNNWDGEIAGSDYGEESRNYTKVYCSDIVELFSSTNCKYLMNKPKVFIFQMCRGEKTQLAISRHVPDGAVSNEPPSNYGEKSPPQIEFVRNYEDTFVAHATIPGHYSYRDTYVGSWCITILCRVFMKEAHEKHLVDLFTNVDNQLKKYRTKNHLSEDVCQTLHTYSIGFNKHLFLNPGYFPEPQQGSRQFNS